MIKTVIIGASTNPARYSYLAANRLHKHGYEIVPVGIRSGEITGRKILDLRKKPDIKNVHTVTMYLNPVRQEEWEEYILSLNPERIIFNPGTKNTTFIEKAKSKGIEVLEACTLVLLGTNTY